MTTQSFNIHNKLLHCRWVLPENICIFLAYLPNFLHILEAGGVVFVHIHLHCKQKLSSCSVYLEWTVSHLWIGVDSGPFMKEYPHHTGVAKPWCCHQSSHPILWRKWPYDAQQWTLGVIFRFVTNTYLMHTHVHIRYTGTMSQLILKTQYHVETLHEVVAWAVSASHCSQYSKASYKVKVKNSTLIKFFLYRSMQASPWTLCG